MGIIDGLKQNALTAIQYELHRTNVYIREFKTAYQYAIQNALENFSISILENKRPQGEHVRRFNAPETNEIGILMPTDPVGERDIVLRQYDNALKRVSELHPSYDALQYPLLFPHGTHGWNRQMKITRKLTNQESKDEVSEFLNARYMYIGSTEAVWRIPQMPMNERFPPFVHLAVHLENGQRVFFTEDTAQERATADPPNSTLTAFFQLCQTDQFASTLLYSDVPRFYTWNNKSWRRRQRGNSVEGHDDICEAPVIGRVYTVSSRQGDCYYLRLLLHYVKGPNNFDDLKRVDGNLCSTYREACLQRGLLQDDNAHHLTLEEASVSISAKQMRQLFAVIIIHCNPSDPMTLWLRHSSSLCEDYAHSLNLEVGDEAVVQSALLELENFVKDMGGHPLQDYGLPQPERDAVERVGVDYRRETAYDLDIGKETSNRNLGLLNQEQCAVHNEFVASALASKTGMFFLDAPGGCGKTFLIQTILATIQSQGRIAIATASSGLAATLLPGGRTIHSTFKVPLNLTKSDKPMCSIKKGTSLARLIKECSAIIIDEAPLSNKLIFEALHRSLCDITGKDKPMGGIATLFCGDFRQILPVVVGGTRANIVNASLKTSKLWPHIKTVTLRTNMRVYLSGDAEAGNFADLLLQLGDGTLPLCCEPDVISLNAFGSCVKTTDELIGAVFPNLESNYLNSDWLAERAILTPLNETVTNINSKLIQMIPGTTYSSIDTTVTDEESLHYPAEFLNSIEVPGLPSHKIKIKIGMPVMIMRSINHPRVMNGTKCVITKANPNSVIVQVISVPYKGEIHCIPRISLQPSDTTLPFTFVRREFPIQPCLAMIINKSQGQTMKYVGLHLTSPVFAHGMLYVALSRTGNSKAVWILAPDSQTRNVYPEALH